MTPAYKHVLDKPAGCPITLVTKAKHENACCFVFGNSNRTPGLCKIRSVSSNRRDVMSLVRVCLSGRSYLAKSKGQSVCVRRLAQ